MARRRNAKVRNDQSPGTRRRSARISEGVAPPDNQPSSAQQVDTMRKGKRKQPPDEPPPLQPVDQVPLPKRLKTSTLPVREKNDLFTPDDNEEAVADIGVPTSRPLNQHRLKPRTFRIGSIPPEVTKGQLAAYLRDLLEDNRPEPPKNPFILSLAPHRNYQTATVTFNSEEPSIFAKCNAVGDREYWTIEDTEISLVVDCDFLGITPLYSAEEPTLDIVAVTGLAGHAFGSWKSRKQNKMWLRDFLPVDLELRQANVRILTFGYDSALKDSTSTNSIQEYSRQLLDAVHSARADTDKERYRPIIFIGHSLGGLIIKQALADALRSSESDQAILDSCVGIFFFGVPHRGLNNQNISTLVKGQRNSHFINDLREGSALLKEAHEHFLQLCLSDCQITSFYETRDTRAVVVLKDGSWDRSGAMVRIVTEESATWALPTEARYMRIPIDADHSDMVKFTDHDDRHYMTVLNRLHECVGKAPGIIENRLANRGKEGEKESKVPEPLFLMPFCENSAFIGRADTLKRLEELLNSKRDSQLRAALSGLGGIGKTTIAVEFCYQRRKAQPRTHIFWVHGDSHETFNASYLDLGREAGLEPKGDDEDAQLKGVKRWLDSSVSGDWMMIIDNFDDVDLYPAKYLPVRRGTILFTTRDERLIEHPAYSVSITSGVKVTAMSDKEALETFSKRLDPTGTGAVVRTHAEASLELLNLLENLPLAIAQAAAYIRETGTDIPKYLEIFKECERNQHDLLGEALPNVTGNERDSSRAVTTTWKITVDRIQQENPQSIQLLGLMSFLSPEEISEEMLTGAPFLKDMRPVPLKKAFALLLNFALLYRLESSNYRLHRLVSFSIRELLNLEDPQRGHELLETAVKLIVQCFPEDISGNMTKCTHLLSHAITSLGHVSRYNLKFPSLWSLQNDVGRVFSENGDNSGALKWYQRAMDGYEKTLGRDHASTLNTVNNMASAFDDQGKYDKALEWYQRALDGYEKTLGRDHPSTLDTVDNMAIVFRRQGKYDKALEWHQRALDGKEKTPRRDHPSTLVTVNNMAIVFHSQGEYDKALVWYQRALHGREKTLGRDHPSTLDTVNNTAIVFFRQGKYDKALVWYQRALHGREKTLGRDHPSTLETVNNTAIVFHSQGEYDKALVWYQRALDGKEKTLGRDHPSTLDTVNNMASVFGDQGEYDKALEWYQRALHGYEKTLGRDHPSTLDTVNNMAIVFFRQGKYDKALEWYQRALDGKEKTLGRDHPSTLNTVNNMAGVFGDQGEYDKALEWYQRALDGKEKTLGRDHSSTLGTVNNMAVVFFRQGKYDKALEWYQRALDGKEKTLGRDHSSTLNTVNNMAGVFFRQGKYDKALEWYQRALHGYEKTLGRDHPSTLRTVNNMAEVKGHLSTLTDAGINAQGNVH
ncbi:hypothetical protein FN846DRAFT_819409 [Sphaerosporella brunnea]|uniref:NB-ARC domain-containing protein n=1 Tax=Sphaerosporella brunnea TaxID=1250544 RepID=A0A5J5EGQ0_9PEZI|nr:hypothetical protein FN846DRAFT_819409 [Sphaerosporella brunnea]